jgi:diaminopimelate epimerase
MTLLEFTKMEGAGNDYVFVDGIRAPFDLEHGAAIAVRIADRNFGVGGDGLIVLAPSEVADVRMVMWNADGSRGSMCGNGIRCLAKLAHDLGVVPGRVLQVETDGGVRRVELLPPQDGGAAAGRVVAARVEMGPVRVAEAAVSIECEGRAWAFVPVDAGNPHAVFFGSADPECLPVAEVGRALQVSPHFPAGVNVEFVRVGADGVLTQRTYERGSGETLACGSGATAVAAAAWEHGHVSADLPTIRIRLRGGMLSIHRTASGLVMEGPARTVFSGAYELPTS